MSRAIGDDEAVSIDRPGTFLRLAAMLFVLGVTAGARADEPPAGFRVGQRVVWRSGEQTRDGGAVVLRDLGKNQVFQVERVEGQWLWLRAEGSDRSGWASADQVVAAGPPDDPAVRRADARSHGGSGSVVVAPFRHVRSGAALRRADAAIDRHDLDRAIAESTEAIRLDPALARAYADRGAAWGMKNEPDRAIPDYDKAIRLDPRNAWVYGNRGAAWLARREYDKAIADFDEAIRLDPHLADAYLNRSIARSKKREYDKAIADCNEAIRLDPHLARAFNDRGTAWFQKGQPDKALADLNEAIRLDPRSANALINRARVWVYRGRHDEAIADLRAIADLAAADRPRSNPINIDFPFTPERRPDPGPSELDKATLDCEQSGWEDADKIDALATAHFSAFNRGETEHLREVVSATRACALTKWKHPDMLVTLALECAEADYLDPALKWLSRANALTFEGKEKFQGEARLNLDHSGERHREPKP